MQQSKCKVLIVEDNRDYSSILHDYICFQPDMDVAGVLNDGDSVIEMISEKQPDVVLLDIIMPKTDGLSVLKTINSLELNKKPQVIIISALSQDRFTQSALSLGAVYYLIKPLDLDILVEKIRSLKHSEIDEDKTVTFYYHKEFNETQNPNIEVLINKLLFDIGISSNLNGYQFIKTAIYMFVEDNKCNICGSKDVYPTIAKKYNTTPEIVEGSMRCTFEKVWKSNDLNLIENDSNSKYINKKIRPSNIEFISTFSDKIRRKLENIV